MVLKYFLLSQFVSKLTTYKPYITRELRAYLDAWASPMLWSTRERYVPHVIIGRITHFHGSLICLTQVYIYVCNLKLDFLFGRQIKYCYFISFQQSHKTINPFGIVAIGPDLDFTEPHGREKMVA